MRKKITSWLLIMALVITMIPATVATVHAVSGTYQGVKYSIDNGVMTIEKGTATSDCPAGSMGSGLITPNWKYNSSTVKKVVVKDGVTDIVNEAFADMPNL